jgi:hypothetical protein
MKQMRYFSPKSPPLDEIGYTQAAVGNAPDYGGVVARTFSTVICGGW